MLDSSDVLGAVGWEAPGAAAPSLALPELLSVIQGLAAPPPIAVLCHTYGAKRAAEAVHRAGVATVIWLRASMLGDAMTRLFFNVIAPALEAAHAGGSAETLTAGVVANGRKIFGSDWSAAGCFSSAAGKPIPWQPREAAGEEAEEGWLTVEAAAVVEATNLLSGAGEELRRLGLYACDVGAVGQVQKLLSSGNQRVVIWSKVGGASERARAAGDRPPGCCSTTPRQRDGRNPRRRRRAPSRGRQTECEW